MPSYAQLQGDIKGWLKRQDIDPFIPSWLQATETDIAEMLRARCMITQATQAIDANRITLPTDFVKFESVTTDCCGALLSLEDDWTGPLPGGPSCTCGGGAVSAYRIVGSCIEFLPHPTIPSPPDPAWQPTVCNISYYAKPRPLLDPQDTNSVLEAHYQIYLFGTVRYGAMWGMDDDRETQMTTRFSEAVAIANRWKEDAQYSGAPLRAVVRGF
jgi:hypothetical protein